MKIKTSKWACSHQVTHSQGSLCDRQWKTLNIFLGYAATRNIHCSMAKQQRWYSLDISIEFSKCWVILQQVRCLLDTTCRLNEHGKCKREYNKKHFSKSWLAHLPPCFTRLAHEGLKATLLETERAKLLSMQYDGMSATVYWVLFSTYEPEPEEQP